MAVREIVRLGHPQLRTPAEPVPRDRIGAPEVQQVVDDLLDTLREAPGVGLSAPQIGVAWQIFAFEYDAGATAVRPMRVVINPLLEPHAGNPVYDWEGCLSVPDLLGLVPRQLGIRLRGLDRHGEDIELELAGFTARVVQHEYDHLHGVIFLDRMRDMRSLTYVSEWEEYVREADQQMAVG
jgi:peptide deformylase